MTNSGNYKLVAFYTGYQDISPKPQALAKDIPCDAAVLSIWNTVDDTSDTFITRDATKGYDEVDEEIYWGTGENCGHQIYPKETTNYIGCNNAHDISVRCSAKKSPSHRVFYTLFRYEPILHREVTRR